MEATGFGVLGAAGIASLKYIYVLIESQWNINHIAMTLTEEYVHAEFAHFENANGPAFLENVADNVSWTAKGSANPLRGHYTSKAEVAKNIFGRMIPKMATPMRAKVTSVLISGDWAIVELKGEGTSKGGNSYDQELCWICRYEKGKIVEARVYLDSALVKAILEE